MKTPLAAKILSVVLYVLMALDLILTLSIFLHYEDYRYFLYRSELPFGLTRWMSLLFIVSLGLLGFWIMIELQLLLRSMADNPFVPTTCSALRRIGLAAAFCTGLLLLKVFWSFTPLTIISCFVMLIGALFCYTLAALFEQAVAYKQDVDLTI